MKYSYVVLFVIMTHLFAMEREEKHNEKKLLLESQSINYGTYDIEAPAPQNITLYDKDLNSCARATTFFSYLPQELKQKLTHFIPNQYNALLFCIENIPLSQSDQDSLFKRILKLRVHEKNAKNLKINFPQFSNTSKAATRYYQNLKDVGQALLNNKVDQFNFFAAEELQALQTFLSHEPQEALSEHSIRELKKELIYADALLNHFEKIVHDNHRRQSRAEMLIGPVWVTPARCSGYSLAASTLIFFTAITSIILWIALSPSFDHFKCEDISDDCLKNANIPPFNCSINGIVDCCYSTKNNTCCDLQAWCCTNTAEAICDKAEANFYAQHSGMKYCIPTFVLIGLICTCPCILHYIGKKCVAPGTVVNDDITTIVNRYRSEIQRLKNTFAQSI